MSPKQLVFVYGTLLSGEGNNKWLSEKSGGVLLAETKTVDANFVMTSNGSFPYVLDEMNGHKYAGQVTGELWSVDTLSHLDILEGVKYDHYRRDEVLLENGETAWMYTSCKKSVLKYEIVKTCDWKARKGLRV